MRSYSHFEYEHDLIPQAPELNTEIIVVIPSYLETDLESTLQSIKDADSLVGHVIEVIVVINERVDADAKIIAFHDLQYRSLSEKYRMKNMDGKIFHFIRASALDAKFAGVGLARKIGMDEATKRFRQINKLAGVIASLDADVRISANYFTELYHGYQSDQKLRAAGIFFEHDLSTGADVLRQGIIDYELHLRYHINMQRYLGLPFAYYTIGSAMSVRASAYLDHFGMNKRQAGEDFYFLHKFIKTGYYTELTASTVFPSSRESERVPFGTGRAVQNINSSQHGLTTYHVESYLKLTELNQMINSFWEGKANHHDQIKSSAIYECYAEVLLDKLEEIKKHTDSLPAFRKRFYHWFDAFRLIKFLHFMRDKHHPDMDVGAASEELFKLLGLPWPGNKELALKSLRKLDRKVYIP